MARTITYQFESKERQPWNYVLNFDDTHSLKPVEAEGPQWTRLGYHQCRECPLKTDTTPFCPVALNLNHVVEQFKKIKSYERYSVTVETPERTYSKECDSQTGLKSIFGLIMACSGCPHLNWLQPLARFHLPFANLEENIFRTLSLQLVSDFLKNALSSQSETAQSIQDRYRKVDTVNRSFALRIRNYCEEDADKNAIAALDCYVQMFSLEEETGFGSLKKLFST